MERKLCEGGDHPCPDSCHSGLLHWQTIDAVRKEDGIDRYLHTVGGCGGNRYSGCTLPLGPTPDSPVPYFSARLLFGHLQDPSTLSPKRCFLPVPGEDAHLSWQVDKTP